MFFQNSAHATYCEMCHSYARMWLAQDSGRVVKHIEAWDVEPARVVRSLIRPSSRVPTNRCARPLPYPPHAWSAGREHSWRPRSHPCPAQCLP